MFSLVFVFLCFFKKCLIVTSKGFTFKWFGYEEEEREEDSQEEEVMRMISKMVTMSRQAQHQNDTDAMKSSAWCDWLRAGPGVFSLSLSFFVPPPCALYRQFTPKSILLFWNS